MTATRFPVVATLVVLIAVAIMIRLGLWQLDRLHQKEAMLAQYARAAAMSSDVALPRDAGERARVYFRHTRFDCAADGLTQPRAGANLRGQTGWVQWGACTLPDGSRAQVNLGWSRSPAPVQFAGAQINGVIAPDGRDGARVVAGQPQPGLEPSAAPDARAVPNNHLSYAVQWFLFALTALAIYGLALRKRLAAAPGRG